MFRYRPWLISLLFGLNIVFLGCDNRGSTTLATAGRKIARKLTESKRAGLGLRPARVALFLSFWIKTAAQEV